jgi:3-hydroxyisobutyrate dehydrogenase
VIAFAEAHAPRYVDALVQGPMARGRGISSSACAADPSLRPVVEPVFDAIASRTLWVAESSSQGSASRLKIATHTYVASPTRLFTVEGIRSVTSALRGGGRRVEGRRRGRGLPRM